MDAKFDNEYGKISINSKVITQIAGYTALDCFGIVGMAALSKSDGIVKLLSRDSLSRGIKLTISEGEISLDFHVIVSYGVAIRSVARNLANSVKYTVESATGLKVTKINIFVEGVRVID